ncbi:MAG: HDOD domain-containing protein [Ignavibacteria bacterium]|nr:HDOD domain-containing protein [Ignavibacteria bacterium]
MQIQNELTNYFSSSFDYLPNTSKLDLEVLKILSTNEVSFQQVVEIINKDHSLAARILALANSPVYGLTKRISTIELAISILGIDTVKDLVIGFSIINSTLKDKDRYFIADAFNQHSYLCGYISQLLANDFDYPVKNEAFVAGLLHDIGIAISHRYLNKEFKLVSELKFYKKINQTKAENLIIGKTHCEIGASIAEKWNLPEPLIDAIRFHHTPSSAEKNQKLVSIVHLADFIASKEAPQYLLSSEDEPLDKSIISILNIPDESYLYDVINNVSNLISTVGLY